MCIVYANKKVEPKKNFHTQTREKKNSSRDTEYVAVSQLPVIVNSVVVLASPV